LWASAGGLRDDTNFISGHAKRLQSNDNLMEKFNISDLRHLRSIRELDATDKRSMTAYRELCLSDFGSNERLLRTVPAGATQSVG
jgi:hypothetical protein